MILLPPIVYLEVPGGPSAPVKDSVNAPKSMAALPLKGPSVAIAEPPTAKALAPSPTLLFATN